MYNIMIVGSRTFNDYTQLKRVVDNLILDNDLKDITIISGGAKGADALAERYANENNYTIKVFPANWDLYGKSAGPIRNRQMVEYIKEKDGVCLIFWDGQSRGTKNDIDLCKQFGVPHKIIRI